MMRIALILCFASLHAAATVTSRITLKDAIHYRKVQVDFVALGGFQGKCIRMKIKNVSGNPLRLQIEAGTRLNSTVDKYQDILVVKSEEIICSPGATRSATLTGFCCQKKNAAPAQNAKFTVDLTPDERLVEMGRFIDTSDLNSTVIQNAIWSISDNQPSATVGKQRDSSLLSLYKLIANLKNEPIPWYYVETVQYTHANGVIDVYNTRLTGDLNFRLDSTSFVTLHILDEHKRPVGLIKSEWKSGGSDQVLRLNIPLASLTKGKYTVQLKSNKAVLTERTFEI